MARRTVEVLSGVGEIWAGDRLFRTLKYRLEVMADESSASQSIEGRLDISGIDEAVVLGRAPQLTLMLEDGRHVVFSLASAAGDIRAMSGLEGVETSRR